MSCLLQSLYPTSDLTIEAYKAGRLFKPDSHGGWEMGTWDYPAYLTLFDEVVKPLGLPERANHDYTWVGPGTQENPNLGSGFWLQHQYTEAQCKVIAEWLKARKLYRGKGVKLTGPNRSFVWTDKNDNPFVGGQVIAIQEKWHLAAIKLFEAPGGVSWYSI